MKNNNMMCEPETYSQALEIIKEFEGCRLTAYLDTGGVWTIGWGSTRSVMPGMVITRDEAESRLNSDFIYLAVEPVSKLVKVECSKQELEALYSFFFNVGETQISSSTLLKKLNAGEDRQNVADEFLRWKYDNGKEIPGLLRRREKERELFLS